MNRFITSIPSPTISYIDLGPVRVHFYALLILIGIVLAVIIANNRLTKRGGESGIVLDIVLWAVPFGIVGGRFYHVVTHWNDYFATGADPMSVFRIWEGGLAIYGALLFGAVGALIGCRISGIRFLSFTDAVAPGILLAQAIGRWGNYFNNELFGTPTDLPWGLQIAKDNSAYPKGYPDSPEVFFHPTFIYESLWSLIGVVLLFVLDRKLQLRWGKLFALYLIYYSIGRILVESIRIDPSSVVLGLRTNIWSAIFGIIVGIAIIVVQTNRHPTVEISVYRPGRSAPVKPEVEADAVDSTVADTTSTEVDEVDSEVKPSA